MNRYVTGSVNELLGDEINKEVSCSSRDLKQIYGDELRDMLQKTIDLLRLKVDRLRRLKVADLVKQVQKVKLENTIGLQLNGILQEQLKTINMCLADIMTMMSEDIELFWSSREFTQDSQSPATSLTIFFNTIISVGLISATFSQMSMRFEDIVLLVNYGTHISSNILSKIIQTIPYKHVNILINVLHSHVKKEFGLHDNEDKEKDENSDCRKEGTHNGLEINARIFLRAFDPVGQMRLSFLFENLEHCLMKIMAQQNSQQKDKNANHVNKDNSQMTNIIRSLLFCAYVSETPVLIRLILRCLKQLPLEKEMCEPYNLLLNKFYYYEVKNLSEITTHSNKLTASNYVEIISTMPQPILAKQYLNFERPESSQFTLNNLNLLFEKIGTLILNQSRGESKESPSNYPSIREALTDLLHKCQSHFQFKNRISSLYMSFNQDSQKKKDILSANKGNSNDDLFIILGQLSEEEDISFLLKVFYYWEELYPSATSLNQPKTVEEYIEQKKITDLFKESQIKVLQQCFCKYLHLEWNLSLPVFQIYSLNQYLQQNKVAASSNENIEGANQPSQRFQKLLERIFLSLPEINGVSESQNEEDLPIGWQFNYTGLFNDLSVFQTDMKRGKIKKRVKQVWQNAGLTSLVKKMEQAEKDIKEFEENDSIESKMEVIKAKNFIHRIQIHLKDIQTIASLFNIFGYGPMFDFLPQNKAEELATLVNYGIKNQLKQIPVDNFKESFQKILDPNDLSNLKADKKTSPPPQPPVSISSSSTETDNQSQMVVQICNASIFPLFELGIDMVTSLSSKYVEHYEYSQESFFTDANSSSIIQSHCKGGESSNIIVNDLIEFFRYLCQLNETHREQQNRILRQSLDLLNRQCWASDISTVDRSIISGILNVVGGWTQSIQPYAKVILNNEEYNQDIQTLLSGGIGSGEKKCDIISTCNPSVLVQTVLLKNLTPINEQEWAINKFDCFSLLFSAIKKCATLIHHPPQNTMANNQPLEDSSKKSTSDQKILDTTNENKLIQDSFQTNENDQSLSNEKINTNQCSQGETTSEMNRNEEIAKEHQSEGAVKRKDSGVRERKKQEENDNEWRIHVGLLMRFLLSLANKLEWNIAVEEGKINHAQGLELLEIIQKMCTEESSDDHLNQRVCEEQFVSTWQQCIDKRQPQLELITFPRQFRESAEKKYSFLKEQGVLFPSLKRLTSSQGANESGDLNEFVLSPSAYMEQLPQNHPETNENKLLKYWEKFVIPKIYEFVKTTLKPYEMEDFFEQIRYPLRKGDQTRAMNVAYIICEKTMPAGVVLPDVNHDWSTISVEDVRIGQWLLATTLNKKTNRSFSPFFAKNTPTVPVLAIGIDARNSAVLCQYQDHDRASLISLWLPVTSLKITEYPIHPPAASYSNLFVTNAFVTAMRKSLSFLSRQVLLQFFSHKSNFSSLEKQHALLADLKLPFLHIVRSAILEEILDDPIFGWIKSNGSHIFLEQGSQVHHLSQSFIPKEQPDKFNITFNFIKNPSIREANGFDHQTPLLPFKKLRQIQRFIDWAALEKKKPLIAQLLDYVLLNFKPLVSLINKYVQEVNLVSLAQSNSQSGQQLPTSANAKPFRLCSFEGSDANSIGAIVLAFRKDAALGVYSGLSFFEDELGINKISSLNTGKESKKHIEPMMFKGRNVYCSFYYNKHQLSPFEVDTNLSSLPCVIYGIPKEWNLLCWLIDSISNSLMKAKEDKESVEMFGIIMTMLTSNFDNLKGPSIIKQLLAKLIIRTEKKLRQLVRNQIQAGQLFKQEGPKNDEQNDKDLDNRNDEINLHWKILGVREQFVKDHMKKVAEIKHVFGQETTLYSSFTQDYVEMLSTLLVPLIHKKEAQFTVNPSQLLSQSHQIPNWLKQMINLQIIMAFFHDNGLLSQEIYQNMVQSQLEFASLQSESILLIENLPGEWSVDQAKENILNLIASSKLRVLNPSLDVFIQSKMDQTTNNFSETTSSTKTCIVLVDGVASLDLEEVALEKKREEEEKLKLKAMQAEVASLPPVPTHPDEWTCEACTLQNRWESLICEVCESPKPENIPVVNIFQKDKDIQETIDNDDDTTPSIEEVFATERREEINKFSKFLDNVKKSVRDFYIQKKSQIQIVIQSKENEKKIITDSFHSKKTEVLKEIERKLVKEQKKMQKVKGFDDQKGRKKALSKKGQPPHPKHPEDDAQSKKLINDEQELGTLKSAHAAQIEDIECDIASLQNDIQKIDCIQDCCSTFQGLNQFTSNDHIQLLEKFLAYRFLDENETNIKQSIMQKIEQRCKSLNVQKILECNVEDIQKKLESLFLSGKGTQVIEIISKLGLDLHLDFVKHSVGEKMTTLPLSVIPQLVKYIEVEICKETSTTLKHNSTNIRFQRSTYNLFNNDTPVGYVPEATNLSYLKLTSYPLADIRLSWALIKLMNKMLQKNVHLINLSSKEEALDHHSQLSKRSGGILHLSLSNQLSESRSFWMNTIKIELTQRVLNMTAIKRDSAPKIQVERLKLPDSTLGQSSQATEYSDSAYNKSKAIALKTIVSNLQKDDFIFTKAFEQIKDVPITLLRPQKPTGSDPFIAFEMIFKGELVMGEAGPYRQFFADISCELQPNVLSAHSRQLNLLVPSTNNLSRLGDSRDKYVLNPSAKSSYQLQLFEFLGVLMGTCVRTGTHLTLDLPRLFWKQLVSEEITVEDLEEIDRPLFDMIKFILSCEKSVFQESFFETFTTTLSDLSTIELKKNGSKINVTYEDRHEYISRVVNARIRESSLQVQTIKKGLNQIIPASLLNAILASDLEMWVCGKKRVDFDLLKRHTIHSSTLSENTPHIQFLWQVLHELSHTEALRFIKFCWGQERLPANDEEFERHQIRFMIKPATYCTAQPDKALPKADTCFFNLELPAYSTKNILRTQLLIAINTDCDSMNAEEPIALDPNQNYPDDNSHYTSEDEIE